MTAPYRFVFSLVSGKGWWKEMVGDAVFGGHPTSIQVFVNKTWKIYIYITPSNDMPDLEDLPFGNMICFISCCLAVFFLEWFFFFLAMKNLTIANWYDFWHVFIFTSNPMSRSAVSWGMGFGIQFLGPNLMPLWPTRLLWFQWFGLKETFACLGVAKKDQPNGQRMYCLNLFKPTSLTYATEN